VAKIDAPLRCHWNALLLAEVEMFITTFTAEFPGETGVEGLKTH
jgi:hypothetical protein